MNAQIFVCPHCGASVDQGLKFCPTCGASLRPKSPESQTRAARFWHLAGQLFLALAALLFGGVGACSAYVLSTHRAVSRDIGDLSAICWGVGIVAGTCCALCLYIIWCRKKSRS